MLSLPTQQKCRLCYVKRLKFSCYDTPTDNYINPLQVSHAVQDHTSIYEESHKI